MVTDAFDTEYWSARLRQKRLRVTHSRLDVIRAMGGSPAPMTAQGVLDIIGEDKADRVTVYRTLNSLVDAGLAHKLDPGDRVWRYGLLLAAPERKARGTRHAGADHGHDHTGDDHAPTGPSHGHAHFVCDACGTVRCLEDATLSIRMNSRDQRGKSKLEKIRLNQQNALLRGTCGDCLDDKPRKRG